MLNPNYAILPWSEVLVQAAYDIAFFVKPAVHSKRFTGMILRPDNRDAKLAECTHVDPTTPCIVAPVSPMPGRGVPLRHRGPAGRGRVLLQMDREARCPPRHLYRSADELARTVAALPWRPEAVFVCDVAVTEDRERAFVVELNPFASSGLYACDTVAIATAIRNHLERR